MPSSHTGTCTACGYTGRGWSYGGEQREGPRDPVVYYYWHCPNCHSTKSSRERYIPPRPDPERSTP